MSKKTEDQKQTETGGVDLTICPTCHGPAIRTIGPPKVEYWHNDPLNGLTSNTLLSIRRMVRDITAKRS